MPTTYRLPNGITVTARGEADSTWNGFPVPILDPGEYTMLTDYLGSITTDEEPYTAEYIDDGKVTAGFYCDGLQWEIVQ